MSQGPTPKGPSFSRRLDVAAVGEGGLRQAIVADEAERLALASFCGIVDIPSLSADLMIRRDGRRGLRVTGSVAAEIRQTCVVTLEAFDTSLLEPLDIRFQPPDEIEAEAARRARRPADGEEDEDDLPDPLLDGRIDLGLLTAEFLALGLDPYPKKPGTVFEPPPPGPGDVADVSPFAVLGRLKPS